MKLYETYLHRLQEGWYDLPSSDITIHSYKVNMTTALDNKRTLDIIKRINQNYSIILDECKKLYKRLKGYGWDEDNMVSESNFIKGLKPILLYIHDDGTAQIRFNDTADFTSGHQIVVELSKNSMKPFNVDMEG